MTQKGSDPSGNATSQRRDAARGIDGRAWAPPWRAAAYAAFALVLLVVLWAGGRLWLPRWTPFPPAPVEIPPPEVARAPVPAPAEPAIRYPVEVTGAAEAASAPLDASRELFGVFGRRTVNSILRVDDFSHRFVATVDNLGRSKTAARLWPIKPTAGRFKVEKHGDNTIIGLANARRYRPLVLAAESVNLPRAVAAYVRLYPQFQAAYEQLGFPKSYFNDRLVEVVDLLLATPDLPGPLAVHLRRIDDPTQTAGLYEFDDPGLESLASGQKFLLRMGSDNEHRLKARLAELRRLLAAGRTGR